MRELDQLKDILAQSAVIIAEIEKNKASIQMLGTYATVSIDEVSKFLQANLESILGAITTTLVNTWGDSLIKRCVYISRARSILINDGGFTPEEAYAILESKKDELAKTITEFQKQVEATKNKHEKTT